MLKLKLQYFGHLMLRVDSLEKTLTCQMGDLGSMIPGLERSPGEGNGNPPQYSCLKIPWTEEPGGYSVWGRNDSDMISRLNSSRG